MTRSGSRQSTTQHRRAVVLGVLLALSGVLWGHGGPAPVAAHAALERSDPANGAVLPSAPGNVTLRYTEPLEYSYSRAELFDQAGNAVPAATSRPGADDFELILDLPPNLGNGTYSVLWRSLSTADGHTTQNYIAFTIGTTNDLMSVVPPATVALGGPPAWLQAAARWVALLGLAAALAVWPVWLLVLRPAIGAARGVGLELARRTQHFAVWAIGVALLGSLAALLVQAATLARPGSRYLDQLQTTVGETRYGWLWLIRIVGLLIYGLVLTGCGWWWPRRHPIAAGLGLTLAAGTPLTFSLIAHAQAQPVGRTVAVAADALHLLAASLWAGGLFLLVGVLPRTVRRIDAAGRRALLARVVPRFSLLALIAWAVMGLTGLYSAWLHVGNWTALRQTAYGQALSVKLLLLTPILALAAFNLFQVTRKLRQAEGAPIWSRRVLLAVGAEAALVVVVLLVAGRLTGLQPARDELAGRADQISINFAAAERGASLILAPGAAGRNHFRLDVSGRTLPPETEALLRLSLPSQETGTKEVVLARAAGNAFEHHGAELSIAGAWEVTLILRQPDQANWSVTRTIPLESTPPGVAVPSAPWRFAPFGGLVGLALLVLGCVGLVAAWQAGRTPFRRESAGLGAVALLLGLVLLIQARIDPTRASLATTNPAITVASGAALTRGAELYRANCVSCHGVGLRGDGPAGAGLMPPPADFTAPHIQLHTDQDLSYWIAEGKQGTGMPAFGDALTAAEIGELVVYLRSAQSGPAATRDVPTAAECTIEPRTLEELAALVATPSVASTALIPAVPPPLASPLAAPAAEAVVVAVGETVRGLIACSNARDTLRRLAYFSDANLRPAFVTGPSASFAQLVATPATPLPDPLQMGIVRIAEITPLVDGRVSARVVIDNPSAHSHVPLPPGAPASQLSEQVALFVLVPDGDRWLIDEVR